VSTTITKLVTADELLAMPDDGNRYELVKGELIRTPFATAENGLVTMELAGPLYTHIQARGLGAAYAAGTGFRIESEPDTVRAPAIAFVSKLRLGLTGTTEGYFEGAPDLVVEVPSPDITVFDVEDKVAEWLEAGARMVWVVSPKLHIVTVYRSLTDIVTLTEKDTLDGGDVVPGFSIAVAEIFGRP
jgi:Uma2 family endonuclease